MPNQPSSQEGVLHHETAAAGQLRWLSAKMAPADAKLGRQYAPVKHASRAQVAYADLISLGRELAAGKRR